MPLPSLFEDGLRLVFSNWSALKLAVENGFCDNDPKREYENFIEDTLDLFEDNPKIKLLALEDFLFNVLIEVFNTEAEDNSPREIAQLLTKLYTDCAAGNAEAVQKLLEIDENTLKEMLEEKTEEPEEIEQPIEVVKEPKVDADGWATIPTKKKRK